MAILNDYDQLIREYFDISDSKTRKYIVSLDEDAQQGQLLTALSSALYDKIVGNVDKIDFGTIPNSRGDITKVEGFENTLECLNIIRKIVIEYKENTEVVDTVLTAIENVRERKAMFMKAFAINSNFHVVLYNLIVLAIEQSVSFLISVCIQYIKDPASQSLEAALDKVAYNNTRENLLYQQLFDFNNSCNTKEFDDILNKMMKGSVKEAADFEYNCCERPSILDKLKDNEKCPVCGRSPFLQFDDEEKCCKDDCENDKCYPDMKRDESDYERMPDAYERVPINGSYEENEPVNEIAVGTIITVGAIAIPTAIVLTAFGIKGVRYIIKVLIPQIRNLTYFFINTRVKISDSLSIQAQFIEANAYKLQYGNTSNLPEDKKKKVIEKQLKFAAKLKKWSNSIAIDNKKAKNKANEMINDDNDPKNIEDMKDNLPPSDGDSDGSLF